LGIKMDSGRESPVFLRGEYEGIYNNKFTSDPRPPSPGLVLSLYSDENRIEENKGRFPDVGRRGVGRRDFPALRRNPVFMPV
jgi:hypothetical protein